MDLGVWQKDLRFARGLLERRPFNCLIQVTNRCNLKCSFCEFWPNPARREDELSLDEFRELEQELAKMGTFLISIEGGEPFVRSDLVEIVRILSQRHITALFTSGWYVTEQNARALWRAGLTHASVSIDYPDPARHDEKRGQPGTSERAWRAIEILRDSAPRRGRQVNVMSVLMADNWRDMDALFRQSAAHQVGHQVTLLSKSGERRGKIGDELPPLGLSAHMTTLFERHRHVRFFRDYFERLDAYLAGAPLPTCHAGAQSFNIDHLGNVSSCIERIGKPVGNVRETPLHELHRRLLGEQDEIGRCQACWTACRGFQQAVGNRGTLESWIDMTIRTRTA